MFNIKGAIDVIRSNTAEIAAENARRYNSGLDSQLKYGRGQCAKYVKRAISSPVGGGLTLRNSSIESAKNYGPCLIKNGFKVVTATTTIQLNGVYAISTQRAGDVVVVAAAAGHRHGHMAMFDGTHWISDFVQLKGFYPAQVYRDNNTSYVMYRYPDSSQSQQDRNLKINTSIRYPILKQNGSEFSEINEILTHIEGEPSGYFMIGRNCMWHGGIHISSATTPWCALSGKAPSEIIDFPLPFTGELFLRCMADGEVVAYRICHDYMTAPWTRGALNISGSFVLIRHYIQPGETKESGLTFYMLYMHLAPWLAYQGERASEQWTTMDNLSAYGQEWLFAISGEMDPSPYKLATAPKGIKVSWDSANPGGSRIYKNRKYGCVTLEQDTGEKLKKGEQVWILVDNNNIRRVKGAVRPSWWTPLLPPHKAVMEFDKVVCPEPFSIKAGDAIGHLGYVQNPTEAGYHPRYQVHIECLSADENLSTFLTNPEGVGRDNPLYLKYKPGLSRYNKNISTGKFIREQKLTRSSGIATLSKLKSEKDDEGKAYYQIFAEQGWLEKNDVLPLLSQYDLAELGFSPLESQPTSFAHLDGKTPPTGLVRQLLEHLLNAAKNDTRFSHALVQHNYQRLQNEIDTNGDGDYSPQEYRRAIHIRSYRDALYRIIAKHPSEWYYKPTDSRWTAILDRMKHDDMKWKKYNETVIEKLGWMQEVRLKEGKGLGPLLWHFHPLVFLNALGKRKKGGWAQSKFAEFLGNVESKNDYSAYNVHVTYKAHYKTHLTSMTIEQVMASQKDISSQGLFAVGRFQITPETLKNAVKTLKLDVSELYDESVQNRIFEEYLIKKKRLAIIDYLEGKGNVEDAIYDWAKEFASAGVRKGKKISRSKNEFEKNPDGSFKYDKKRNKIGVQRWAKDEGVSYYSGDGINKANIKPDDMVRVLEISKNEAN